MDIQENVINKVAQSTLLTFDLASLYATGPRVVFDIKDNLFQGLMLREKDFREFIKTNNWESYQNKNVAIVCTSDAIVPTWAYMLLASKLNPFVNSLFFGDLDQLEIQLYCQAIQKLDIEQFRDQKIVIKGFGNLNILYIR